MNPDVMSAIARLRADNILPAGQAALFGRVASRQLVSVRFEIRTLLYVGVLLLTSGVGILLSKHHQEIGPLAIAGGLGLAAAACLVWVSRKAAPFSWEEVQSPNVAFDYVLLLGLLLLASDLAYIEVQFTVLGPHWAHHLLVVGAVYLVAAYVWDSQTVLGLALTTLAAWLGISVSVISGSLWAAQGGRVRVSALALGALYVAAAALSVQQKRKAHFEPIFANMGLLLLFGALASGALDGGPTSVWWLAALLTVAGLVMWLSFDLGRSLYFAQAVVAAYVGLVRFLVEVFPFGGSLRYLLTALLGVGVLALLFAAHRKMRER